MNAKITTPREHPILFSAPMVRALLDGRKTQTRRIVTGCVESPGDYTDAAWGRGEMPRCPYGEPGGRLWVRETWRTGVALDKHNTTQIAASAADAGWAKPWAPVKYEADGRTNNWDTIASFGGAAGRIRQSIYMPRWASRITLAVTSVRVERLQDITEADAKAEGVDPRQSQDFWSYFCAATHDVFDMTVEPDAEYMRTRGITHVQYQPGETYTAADEFRRLWQEINGKRAPWASNPWVWVVGFEVLR